MPILNTYVHFCNPLFLPPRPVPFQNGVDSHSFASHPVLPIRIHLHCSRLASAPPSALHRSWFVLPSFPTFLLHSLSLPLLTTDSPLTILTYHRCALHPSEDVRPRVPHRGTHPRTLHPQKHRQRPLVSRINDRGRPIRVSAIH